MLRRKLLLPSSSPTHFLASPLSCACVRFFHSQSSSSSPPYETQQALSPTPKKSSPSNRTLLAERGDRHEDVIQETYDSKRHQEVADEKRKITLAAIEDDVVAMASEKGFFSVSQSTSQALAASPLSAASSFTQQESDDPASRYRSSASEDFFMDINLRRKRLKPTFQQLEFPSGMTERISSSSVQTSRVGALYQLHYSDTNVREIIKVGNEQNQQQHQQGKLFPIRLFGISSQDYLSAKTWLLKEASGQENNFVTQRKKSLMAGEETVKKFDRDEAATTTSETSDDHKDNEPFVSSASAASSTHHSNQLHKSSDDDAGFLFTLYLENITTDGALTTIAGRFGIRKSDIQTLRQYSKDQCTTQLAWAKSAVLCKEQILALNLMSFPGFCIKTCFNHKLQLAVSKYISESTKDDLTNQEQKKRQNSPSLMTITRREFSFGGVAVKLHRNEVTTLLRRLQVGNEDTARSLFYDIQQNGSINYYSHITQESFIYGFRRLQDKKFKSAFLQLLRHKNIRPELREFIKNPSQHQAALARKAIGNEVVRGMLRVFVDTDSYYRTIEAAPGDYRSLMYRSARKVAWNTMASKRIRSEIVSGFNPGAVDIKLRVGDFVLVNNAIREQMNSSGDSSTPGIHLDDVMFLSCDDDIARCKSEFGCTELDIVIPVPSFGILKDLSEKFNVLSSSSSSIKSGEEKTSSSMKKLNHPADFMRLCLRETRLLGLVETPELWEEAHWKYIMNITNGNNSNNSSSSMTFRRLLMNTKNVFVATDEADGGEHATTMKAKIEVALDPAPTPTSIFDCNRLLLNDRLLLQAGRRNLTGLLDRYLPPNANLSVASVSSPSSLTEESQEASPIISENEEKELESFLKEAGLSSSGEEFKTSTKSTEPVSKILDGLDVDSLVTSKLLKKSSLSRTFNFTNPQEEAELRHKLKLPAAPIDVERLTWGISDSNFSTSSSTTMTGRDQQDGTSSPTSSSSIRPAMPISDTSRLTTVVTALLQVQLPPSNLPTLLRETLNLHGVMSEEEARLQQKIHATIRGIDTEDKSVWSKNFCPICYSLEHSQSSECPIHQRRMAVRVAKRERHHMAQESNQRTSQLQKQEEELKERKELLLREKQQKDKENENQQRNHQERQQVKNNGMNESVSDSNKTSSTTSSPTVVVVSISRSANDKNKWGVKVDKNLILAEGCETMQPTLGPYVPRDTQQRAPGAAAEWKIVRVGKVPVATFEQLKLALAACNSDGEAELVLRRE